MSETALLRKNKITLSDYDYKADIENRLLMAKFSTLDLEILEEILYNSLSIPLEKLCKNLDIEEKEALPTLKKLSKTGLLTFDAKQITVDKEMRKYFEAQILEFDEDFKPGMEFLQGLLRKVPIHLLPNWYSIPRTSNNIFDSIVEKQLLTPQIFQRYVSELTFPDPVQHAIVEDLFNSEELKLSGDAVMEKYRLTHEQFEEHLLHLEFNFVCCLGREKAGKVWKEVVTPFHEWKEYLLTLRHTETHPIEDTLEIERTRAHDYSFVQDMGTLLTLAKKQPLSLPLSKTFLASFASKCEDFSTDHPTFLPYVQHLTEKLLLLEYAEKVEGRLSPTEAGIDWMQMNLELRALHLYRHPLNRLLTIHTGLDLAAEHRQVREAEKSILRILHGKWVYFDEFLKGVFVPLHPESTITLKRVGKCWKYTLPQYTEADLALIKATLFEWLFEAGMVATGTHMDRECFCVTPFGCSLFSR